MTFPLTPVIPVEDGPPEPDRGASVIGDRQRGVDMHRSGMLSVFLSVALASVAYAQANDHEKCYKIKDTVKLAALVAEYRSPEARSRPLPRRRPVALARSLH